MLVGGLDAFESDGDCVCGGGDSNAAGKSVEITLGPKDPDLLVNLDVTDG